MAKEYARTQRVADYLHRELAALIQKAAGMTKNRLSHSEARAYLDLADWDVDCAVENVREDFGWSAAEKGNAIRKMGSLEVE